MQLNEIIRHGAGFAVVEPSDLATLCEFRAGLISRSGTKNLDDLRQTISQLPNSEVNQMMVKLLGFTEAQVSSPRHLGPRLRRCAVIEYCSSAGLT